MREAYAFGMLLPPDRTSGAVLIKDAAKEAWRYVSESATPEGVGASELDEEPPE